MKKIILFITITLFALSSQAQSIYNNGARIVSESGTSWVIADGNFTLTSQSATNLTAMAKLDIESNAALIIEPQSFLTVNGTITNNAGTSGLIIQSDASGTASLIHNNNSVDATFEHYIAPETWNLISSPFVQGDGATAGGLVPTGGQAYLRPYTDGSAWGDYIIPLETQFIPLKGYALWLTNEKTISFTGLLLNGTQTKSLANGNNWNLVGNPYPSALDWELAERTNVSTSMYLWDNTYAGLNNGNYNTYNASSQVGVPVATTNIVPAFQGFFVQATGAGASITFNNSARLHSNQAFYKDLSSQTQMIVRMKITDSQNRFDELAVCVNPNANNNFDDFDSRKMSAQSDAPEIFTLAQSEQLIINAIQTMPIVIPVNIKTSQAGMFTLNAFEISSDVNTTVKLQDTQLGIITDLRSNAENNVTLLQGDNNNRFFLQIGNTLSINEVETVSLNTIVRDNQIYIYASGNQTITKVSLFDVIGKEIATQYCNGSNCNISTVNIIKGVYIVKALIGKEYVTRKLNIY